MYLPPAFREDGPEHLRELSMCRRVLLILMLSGLAACHGGRLPAPAPAPQAEWVGAFDLRGTEPFWSVRIREDALVIERPDHPVMTAPNPGPDTQNGVATWSTTTTSGSRMSVTLRKAGSCSDGMSDQVYPFAATFWLGEEVLQGCGTTAR